MLSSVSFLLIYFIHSNLYLLITYPYPTPPRFPLPTGNQQFVSSACESALKLSFVPCSWLLQPFQKRAKGFLDFPVTSFCRILPFIVVFHFVLLLSPHHCFIANCFPLIIMLTNQHIAKVIKHKPEPCHLQKQRFHVPPMMFISASFPSGNK